jgi:hypothetical protein
MVHPINDAGRASGFPGSVAGGISEEAERRLGP